MAEGKEGARRAAVRSSWIPRRRFAHLIVCYRALARARIHSCMPLCGSTPSPDANGAACSNSHRLSTTLSINELAGRNGRPVSNSYNFL